MLNRESGEFGEFQIRSCDSVTDGPPNTEVHLRINDSQDSPDSRFHFPGFMIHLSSVQAVKSRAASDKIAGFGKLNFEIVAGKWL
ncbi:hypothetical protein SH661x_000234 [Planctomicrobium sp. SH661]|uniref:hypothetical protein n=1 Tax=Planctomicrobium sp. SH661 TaxID=3448124 RepID=UPI003F5B9E23